jgi:hypothetical protein
VVFLVACGGGSDSPADKCDDLVDIVCDRAIECVPSAGTHASCVTEANGALNCDAATGVTAQYPSCLSMVRTLACATLFPNDMLTLPSECSGVILIGEGRVSEPEALTPMTSALEVATEIE